MAMYSIEAYGRMIMDRRRMDAYVQALRQAVKPRSVVLDIGTGTGIFAMLACQFGARRVYAVEPSDAIQVAREIASDNGYAERIEFIQDLSTHVTLSERADVIISDLRGVLPLFEHHLPSIVDARQRLLAPGGILIPNRDTLWVAVVETPEMCKPYTSPWNDNCYGLNMQSALQIVTNTWSKRRASAEQLLVEPQCWATLDYNRVESANLSAKVTWPVTRAGTAHGLGVWFDSFLADGVTISNAPGAPELIYGSAYFPLLSPVPIVVGDVASVDIKANLVGDDYIWCWDTRFLAQGDPQGLKAHFKQSTFYGVPLSPAQLRKTAASYAPILSEDGQIDRFILDLMDKHRSLDEIARSVFARWSFRFATWSAALRHVSELSKEYSH